MYQTIGMPRLVEVAKELLPKTLKDHDRQDAWQPTSAHLNLRSGTGGSSDATSGLLPGGLQDF
jgi:hypothetical protein